MASMLGAFVVPFMNKAFYKKLLLFMVSLAVGVLGGSGIFHLIPHVRDFFVHFNIIISCMIDSRNLTGMLSRISIFSMIKHLGQEDLTKFLHQVSSSWK